MKILAIDYGEARTGIAVCDGMEIIASPLCVIHEKDFDKLVEKVAGLIAENSVEEAVVGNPINMNGTKGAKSEECVLFAERLRGRTGVAVVMWDERLTTVSANNIMNEVNRRGKRRKETVDAVAAALILESYIGYRKNQRDIVGSI